MEQFYDEAIVKIREKMEWVIEKNKNKIPYDTDENGNYIDYNTPDKICWWTNGFWGGLVWLMYQETKDEKYIEYARNSNDMLKKCFDIYLGLHHDVGFMFMPTSGLDYKLTGSEESRKTTLHAANLLAGRFNINGNFIRAWNEWGGSTDTKGWAIIDCMMNLSLLYWASEEIKDPRYKNIAMAHADTVMKNFVREDGSVNHIVEFDLETGEMVCSHGGQGYGVGSSWTRGQAWALYGFVISYAHTKEEKYLNTAKRVAHYCLANIGDDGLIPIDFRQPADSIYEDSCGAAIMASGLIELAKHVNELEKDMYNKGALKILKALYDSRCDFTTDCDAIIQNASSAYHSPEGNHINMSYADYYFVEAIFKLNGIDIITW